MTPKETRSAIVIFVLLLPSLAAVFWSGRKAADIPQPGPVRSFTVDNQDHAAVFFNGALHLVDGQGRRLTRQPLPELGLAGEPTDMDITADAQGRVQAWFFDDTVPRIVRCELDASALFRMEKCAPWISGPQLKIDRSSQAVHIAVEPARDRVFVADARGHGVRVFNLQGRQLAEGGKGELFFPNRLRVVGDQLVVADNDHRRLVWLDARGDTPSLLERRTLPLAGHPDQRGGRKAADFAMLPGADGKPAAWWVLAVKQGQKDGQVLLYDGTLQPRGSADLGGHSDPLIIDRLGRDLLVADFAGIALYRVGADGKYLGAFGSGAFARELADARGRLRMVEVWKYAGWAGMAITLLVGSLLAWRFSEKPGATEMASFEAAALATPDEAAVPIDPLDLKPAAWHRRQAVLLAGFMTLMTAAVAALFVFIVPHEIPPALWKSYALWLAPLAAVVAVGTSWAGARGVLRRRLWLGQGRIEVREAGKTVATVSPDRLLASPRMLLVGHLMLPYRAQGAGGRPGRWIYDEHLLRRYVLAHLGARQRLTDADLVRMQMKRMPRWQWAVIALLAVAAVGYLLAAGLLR